MEVGFLFVLYIIVTSKSLPHISEEFVRGMFVQKILPREGTTILFLRFLAEREVIGIKSIFFSVPQHL